MYQPQLPKFKDTVKFLVDNDLQVYENSTIKALEIMGKMKVEMHDIQPTSVSLSKDVMRALLVGMLKNSRSILTDVLGGKKANSAHKEKDGAQSPPAPAAVDEGTTKTGVFDVE